ncbi:MAG TPA: hypothetical protein VFE62_28335 [Gemmataceae bacterium]|nr:hypothetical protein [Gemmataceae bacterium]
MRWIRVMTLAGLLAAAGIAGAQAPDRPPTYVPPGQSPATPFGADRNGTQQCEDCPFASAPTWYYRSLLDAAMAWQRLRAVCGATKAGGCCEMAVCGKANLGNSGGCVIGVAGCAKGCELVQAPKSCCCVKECACCETCKSAKAQKTVQIERVQIAPMPCPMSGIACQIAPATLPMMPHNVFMPVNLGGRTAKFVTPDFEAHCAHISQRGDTVELTGNVLLLCKKNAQPVRIEAQRIVLNLANGTYVADSVSTLPAMSMPMSVGTMRMSIIAEPAPRPNVPATSNRGQESVRPATLIPASGVIEVIPVPQTPRPR